MREVDQPALIVPDVFAVDDHIVAYRERDPLADLDVVGHEHGLRCTRETNDEPLMPSRWSVVVGEEPRDRTLRGHLHIRAALSERSLDGGVVDARDRGAAARAHDREEDDRAEGYDRQGRPSQRPTALRMRPAATSSASAITTTMAMRRKSLTT
jgi:hypothetical protein